ncbi:MAG: hypothetical protein CSA97_05435 [Bacteroidetes bacterium]|nr:MAG: hypothetical protein CSA97_05435 [Bacteroidota bacterium]
MASPLLHAAIQQVIASAAERANSLETLERKAYRAVGQVLRAGRIISLETFPIRAVQDVHSPTLKSLIFICIKTPWKSQLFILWQVQREV